MCTRFVLILWSLTPLKIIQGFTFSSDSVMASTCITVKPHFSMFSALVFFTWAVRLPVGWRVRLGGKLHPCFIQVVNMRQRYSFLSYMMNFWNDSNFSSWSGGSFWPTLVLNLVDHVDSQCRLLKHLNHPSEALKSWSCTFLFACPGNMGQLIHVIGIPSFLWSFTHVMRDASSSLSFTRRPAPGIHLADFEAHTSLSFCFFNSAQVCH